MPLSIQHNTALPPASPVEHRQVFCRVRCDAVEFRIQLVIRRTRSQRWHPRQEKSNEEFDRPPVYESDHISSGVIDFLRSCAGACFRACAAKCRTDDRRGLRHQSQTDRHVGYDMATAVWFRRIVGGMVGRPVRFQAIAVGVSGWMHRDVTAGLLVAFTERVVRGDVRHGLFRQHLSSGWTGVNLARDDARKPSRGAWLAWHSRFDRNYLSTTDRRDRLRSDGNRLA